MSGDGRAPEGRQFVRFFFLRFRDLSPSTELKRRS